MSSKYKVHDNTRPYFITLTVYNWIDIFTRQIYREIICESINYCQDYKGLRAYGWCVMTNHIHLLITSDKLAIPEIVRDIKKFTAKKILKEIAQNPQESRKKWLLNEFTFAGKISRQQIKFWKSGYHPVECGEQDIVTQKLDYIHYNPVKAGFAIEPEHWAYSSARAYAGDTYVPVKTELVDL